MRRYWMTRCQPVTRRSGVIASDTSSNRSAQMPVVSVMSSIGFALSRPVNPLKVEPEERRERHEEHDGFDEANQDTALSSQLQLQFDFSSLSCQREASRLQLHSVRLRAFSSTS